MMMQQQLKRSLDQVHHHHQGPPEEKDDASTATAPAAAAMPPTIYYPPTADRVLSYASSQRMKYKERSQEEKAGLMHCPHVKMIVNDVAFLTEKARAGDTVIYIGGTIGSYLPVVVRMFPTLQFLVYDGNPDSHHYQRAEQEHPPNLHLKPVWFSQDEAVELTKMQPHQQQQQTMMAGQVWASGGESSSQPLPLYDPRRTLLMVDARNVTRNPGIGSGNRVSACYASQPAGDGMPTMVNRSTATEENVLKDMHEQETWIHILRPKSAILKFRLPFTEGNDAINYSYLKGKMYLQPFSQKSSTEVRLCVDAPSDPFAMYPRDLYNSEMHEECLFYHNCVTRRMHMASDCRIKVSWDQHASHKVLEQWVDKALHQEDISGIGISGNFSSASARGSCCFIYTHPSNALKLREAFVKERINLIDSRYGRTLGCRVNATLKQYVQQDNHLKKREIIEKRKQEKALRRSMREEGATQQLQL